MKTTTTQPTMKIAEIRKRLLGKDIVYNDGFSNRLNMAFTIGHVAKDGKYLLIQEAKGHNNGIYISKALLAELLADGYTEQEYIINNCSTIDSWALYD